MKKKLLVGLTIFMFFFKNASAGNYEKVFYDFKIESITGKSFNDDPVPFQVISDHIRMLSFAIADGALPSNDGRGYVLRRILRRAARFGRSLDMNQPFIFNLVGTVEKIMGDTFPEIVDKKRISIILKNIKNKSIKNKIDPKITNRIWRNMILAYIDFEKRNFKK